METIKNLTSDKPHNAIAPFAQICPLFPNLESRDSVFKCDWRNNRFEELHTPGFDFSGHSTVQVGADFFAISEA